MLIITIINLAAVFFAFLSRRKSFKYGLEIAFVIIAVFLALRYDLGNDYMAYLTAFERINSSWHISDSFGIDVGDEHAEYGWIFLCLLCKPIGFWGMTILLSLFESYILYKLIKQYVPRDWYWLAVFVYVFTPTFMLVGLSAMRQFLAMILYIYSIRYIIDGRFMRFVLLIGLAGLFHTSALVLLPTYFVRYMIKSKRDYRIPIFAVMSVLALAGREVFRNVISSELFDRYSYYMQTADISVGAGVLFNLLLLLVALYYYQYQQPVLRLLFLLSFIAYLFIPLQSIVPAVARVAFYFSILTIVVYPVMFRSIRDLIPKTILLTVYIGFTCMTYIWFFESEVWYEKFAMYQTIFSVPGWH